jgi:hypothetical protein
MGLKEQLAADLKDAMRARDEVRMVTLRGALAAVRLAEDAAAESLFVKGGRTAEITPERQAAIERARALSEEQVLAVVQKQVKQRRDSMAEFEKAGRPDLVAKEAAELAVLQQYLPAQLDRDAIAVVVRAVMTETGASGPADKGRLMPVLMQRLAGQAEGREINAVVSELLGGR